MAGGTGIVGIIGGMGPLAAWDLATKITEATAARTDQEHVRVIIDSNTNIPDRTEALLSGGADPAPELSESARILERAGATVLTMACNTAHCFHEAVAEAISIPVLHMPLLTADELAASGVKAAAVLATDGTIQTGIYDNALTSRGIRPVHPEPENQAVLMDMIYGYVKAGNLDFSGLPVQRVLDDVKAQGAEVLVLACTELPMAFEAMGIRDGVVDPTLVLAKAAIKAVGAPLA